MYRMAKHAKTSQARLQSKQHKRKVYDKTRTQGAAGNGTTTHFMSWNHFDDDGRQVEPAIALLSMSTVPSIFTISNECAESLPAVKVRPDVSNSKPRLSKVKQHIHPRRQLADTFADTPQPRHSTKHSSTP